MAIKDDAAEMNRLFEEFCEARKTGDSAKMEKLVEQCIEIGLRNPTAVRLHANYLLKTAKERTSATPDNLADLSSRADGMVQAAREASEYFSDNMYSKFLH